MYGSSRLTSHPDTIILPMGTRAAYRPLCPERLHRCRIRNHDTAMPDKYLQFCPKTSGEGLNFLTMRSLWCCFDCIVSGRNRIEKLKL